MHGGASCFTNDSASTIDFFVTSQMFRAQSITCFTTESGLATHRPVVLMFNSFRDTGRVKWIEKTPRPPSDLLFGPKASFTWDTWGAQMKAFVTRHKIGNDTLFGEFKGNQEATKVMELLWDDWLEGAEVEIRANFGVSTPNKPGAPYDIKQGSLQQALATREAKCMKNHKATRWALRRCQEVVSHYGKGNLAYPPLVSTRLKWSKSFYKLGASKDLLCAPGIAQDLSKFWSCTKDIANLQNWVDMLGDQLSTLTK